MSNLNNDDEINIEFVQAFSDEDTAFLRDPSNKVMELSFYFKDDPLSPFSKLFDDGERTDGVEPNIFYLEWDENKLCKIGRNPKDLEHPDAIGVSECEVFWHTFDEMLKDEAMKMFPNDDSKNRNMVRPYCGRVKDKGNWIPIC